MKKMKKFENMIKIVEKMIIFGEKPCNVDKLSVAKRWPCGIKRAKRKKSFRNGPSQRCKMEFVRPNIGTFETA